MRRNGIIARGALAGLLLSGCSGWINEGVQAPEVTATVSPSRLPFQGGQVQVTAQAKSHSGGQVQITLSLFDDQGELQANSALPAGTTRWTGALTVPANGSESGCNWTLRADVVDGYGLHGRSEVSLIQDGFVAPVGDSVPVSETEGNESTGNIGTEQTADGQPPVPVFNLP